MWVRFLSRRLHSAGVKVEFDDAVNMRVHWGVTWAGRNDDDEDYALLPTWQLKISMKVSSSTLYL